MESQILQTVLILAITASVLALLNKGSSKTVEKNDFEEYELRLNKLYHYVGYGIMLVSVVLLISLIFAINIKETEASILIGLLMVFFGGFGILLILYYKNHKLSFNDKYLVIQNSRGKVTELKWHQIEKIKFSSTSGYIKVTALNEKHIIHSHLVGLKLFLQKLEQHTDFKVADLKIPIKMN